MEIEEFLKPENVIIGFTASSKKQALELLSAHLIHGTDLNHHDVLAGLHERERLGSTGVGSGVAIPHTRIDGIDKVTGLYARLDTPINFDAIDEKPVDLVFMLIMPEEGGADNLKALAKVSKALRLETVREKLRNTREISTTLKLFASPA
jgi:PTS system nitrogen regulatory IIA component